MTTDLIGRRLGALVALALATACADEPFTASSGNASVGGAGGEGAAGGAGAKGGDGSGGAGNAGALGGASDGGGGTAGGGGSTPVCQPLGQPCADCTFASCNTEYCACYAIEECASLVGCLNGCGPGDDPCLQGCMTAHPESISQSFLLGDCAAQSCAADCPGAEMLEACSTCLFTACADQMNTCLASPDCAAILQCVQQTCAPNDQDCALACGSQHPSGQAAAFAVNSCLGQQCDTEC